MLVTSACSGGIFETSCILETDREQLIENNINDEQYYSRVFFCDFHAF